MELFPYDMNFADNQPKINKAKKKKKKNQTK